MWNELPGEVKKAPPAIILVVSLDLGPGTRFNRYTDFGTKITPGHPFGRAG